MATSKANTSTAKLSREQAVKLFRMRTEYLAAEAIIGPAKARQDELLRQLQAVHEFAGIPLDGVKIDLEGREATVAVSWAEGPEAKE